MIITIPGNPIAQKRPRFARRGKFVTTYSEQETEAGKFFLIAREQVKEKLSGPLKVLIFFNFARPKSHYGTGKNQGKLKDGAPVYYSGKDIDNLCKFVLDCLNGLAWDDDSQIVDIGAIKSYGDIPETLIIIDKLPG